MKSWIWTFTHEARWGNYSICQISVIEGIQLLWYSWTVEEGKGIIGNETTTVRQTRGPCQPAFQFGVLGYEHWGMSGCKRGISLLHVHFTWELENLTLTNHIYFEQLSVKSAWEFWLKKGKEFPCYRGRFWWLHYLTPEVQVNSCLSLVVGKQFLNYLRSTMCSID